MIMMIMKLPIQSCPTLGDPMGWVSSHLTVLHYFFDLFYDLVDVSFNGKTFELGYIIPH